MENTYNKLIKCYEENGIICDKSKEDIDIRNYDVDSIMFMSLVISIEEKFDIIIPDYLMNYDAFISAKSIAIFIDSQV